MVLDMLTAAQGGTCAIIKVQCCVYIPDLSGSVSAALDAMKSHVKAMWDENIPFWTLVLSWVKGDWWKTIFIIVTVVLIVLLCGPCILQCSMNFVTQRLLSFSQTGSWRARCNISLWMMLILWVKSIKRGEWKKKKRERERGEWRRKQNRLYLESRAPSWARLWTLSYMPSIYGNYIPTWNQAPRRKSLKGLYCLKEYPNYLCNQIELYILLCLLGYDHRPIDNCPLLTT